MIDTGQYIYAIIWGIILITVLIGRTRQQYAKGAKMALVWLLIIAAVFSVAVYWPEFKNTKLYTSLVPGSATIDGESMEFTRAADGHFHITAKVNEESITFLVDTGASDIALNLRDARRIGLHPEELNFTKSYTTANGTTRGAPVRLRNIQIGTYQTGEIAASVNEGELENSLLGMSFLNRMRSFRIEGDRLIIKP